MPVKKPKSPRMTPTQKKQLREDSWGRVFVIYQLTNPKQVDLWWARKFLRTILVDPYVVKGVGRRQETFDEGPSARQLLEAFERKWPEPNYDRLKPSPNGKVTPARFTSPAALKVTRCALKGVNKKLKEQKRLLSYWGIRFNNMPISNPNWSDLRIKVKLIREELSRLEKHRDALKARLK